MRRIGPEILGRLFDEHARALVLFARPLCLVPEDVVQDAFIALARQDPPPDRPDSRAFSARPCTPPRS